MVRMKNEKESFKFQVNAFHSPGTSIIEWVFHSIHADCTTNWIFHHHEKDEWETNMGQTVNIRTEQGEKERRETGRDKGKKDMMKHMYFIQFHEQLVRCTYSFSSSWNPGRMYMTSSTTVRTSSSYLLQPFSSLRVTLGLHKKNMTGESPQGTRRVTKCSYTGEFQGTCYSLSTNNRPSWTQHLLQLQPKKHPTATSPMIFSL